MDLSNISINIKKTNQTTVRVEKMAGKRNKKWAIVLILSLVLGRGELEIKPLAVQRAHSAERRND